MLPKRPRHPTFDYLGKYRYFLTFTTHRRNDVFKDAEVVALALLHILRSAGRCQFAISAYCFMPDHLHMLVQGQADNSDLRGFVKHAKQASGFAYAQTKGSPLWQPSFYDHVLRDDESSLRFIAYILRNPVVGNLATTCLDYPFLGSTTDSIENLIAMLREGLGARWETEGTIVLPVGAGLKACATSPEA